MQIYDKNAPGFDSVIEPSRVAKFENAGAGGGSGGATVNNATITIQKNGTTVDSFTSNQATDKTINITVPTSAADVSALPATTKYASALRLTINSSTFVVTGQLIDQDGNDLGTAQTIDLPLESVVVNGSYNSQTKKVVLTLQNGNTIEFSVADLVSGLQTELSASNKLNPAYINYDSTHRAVSDTEKSTWNSKQNAIDSSHKLSADLVDDTNATNKFATAEELKQIETNKNNISTLQTSLAVGSSDNAKVLTAIYEGGEGSYAWVTPSGGGGTSDYTDLTNKPQINGITLNGNKSLANLGIAAAEDIPTLVSGLNTTGTVKNGSSVTSATGYTPSPIISGIPYYKDTTYESKSAASGGTAVSLCTTGEKYTWNNKQSALTTTQLNAVNSGINSTKVEQISTNQTNIGKVQTQANWNTNNGVKNLIKPEMVQAGEYNSVTYSVNSDGSITVNGTATGGTSYVYISINDHPINIKQFCDGNHILTGCPSGGSAAGYKLYAAKGNYAKYDYGEGVLLTETSETEVFLVISIPQGVTVNNLVFRPMIRPAFVTDDTFQPYALPNTKITPELIELVDSGAKNLLLNKATTTTSSAGLTYTVNTDKSITVTGSSTNHNAFNVGGSRTYANALPLPKGKYMVSGGVPLISQKPIYIQFGVMSDSTASISWHNIDDTPYELTISNDTTRIVYEIYSPDGSYSGYNVTFYPMICSKAAWDVSQKYVPYRPTYEDTVEQVAENKNNILSKIGASDYATQNTGGTVRVWTTTDGTDTILHIANEAPTP